MTNYFAPEDNLLRAMFLTFQCEEDEAKIKQYFVEIFKFYNEQPYLQVILQIYLLYIMASFGLTIEQISALMETISPKSKENLMTTYEVLINKGKQQGRVEGLKLNQLQTIWNAHLLQLPVSTISAVASIPPSMVNKWLKRFEWMRQGETDGLNPTEIMLKVNELAEELVVTELEVTTLLAFFKENLVPKTKKRQSKKKT